MLVIYDLDKTSLYCPIADFLDNFIPKKKILKKIYYMLYPIAHEIEMKYNLLQINHEMFKRAKGYQQQGATQIVVTARHYTHQTMKHVRAVFQDVPVVLMCVAQGITNKSKAEYVAELPRNPRDEIIMYDDNFTELSKMNEMFDKFIGIQVFFKDNKEEIQRVY